MLFPLTLTLSKDSIPNPSVTLYLTYQMQSLILYLFTSPNTPAWFIKPPSLGHPRPFSFLRFPTCCTLQSSSGIQDYNYLFLLPGPSLISSLHACSILSRPNSFPSSRSLSACLSLLACIPACLTSEYTTFSALHQQTSLWLECRILLHSDPSNYRQHKYSLLPPQQALSCRSV